MGRARVARWAVGCVLGAAVLLAGCTSTISGRAGPVAGDVGPSTAPSADPELVATAADLPALVVVVEAVFDAFAVPDFVEVCRYFDLGQEPPPEDLLGDCAAAVEQGFAEGSAGTPPAQIEAGRRALSSLSVDTTLVELDGPRALVTNASIVSAQIPDRGFYGSDLGLVLTDAGWRVDPDTF